MSDTAADTTETTTTAREGSSSLLRSNIVVATGTALSRITGLAHVAAFGYVIGQTALADAYRIGNETPNIVYEVLLGGVVSATFVPLFTDFKERDDEESTNVVVTLAMVGLFAATVIALFAAPLIFGVYTLNPNETVDEELFREVGVSLTRIFLIQIFFYGATGVANALLQSRKHFFAAAWSPIVANIVIIVSLLSIPQAGEQEYGLEDVLTNDRLRWTLGLGATLGIVAMAAVLRAGDPRGRHPAALAVQPPPPRRAPRPRAVGLDARLRGGQPDLGDRRPQPRRPGVRRRHRLLRRVHVLHLPVRAAGRLDRHDVRSRPRTIRGPSRQAVVHAPVVARPANDGAADAAGRRLAARPSAADHRRVPAARSVRTVDALNTSNALGGFALGLVGLSVYVFALRGFYAHQDTRTPFVINLFENLLNVVLALVLVGRWGVLGLGLAFALAYLISSVWAIQVLSYKVPGFPIREVFGSFWRMIVAGALAGEVAYLAGQLVGGEIGTAALVRVSDRSSASWCTSWCCWRCARRSSTWCEGGSGGRSPIGASPASP